MTPDRIGRGSFHVSGHDPRRALAAAGPGSAQAKKGPEKSDPTPLSYHTSRIKSTANPARCCKICALHKSRCAHLGNIPS